MDIKKYILAGRLIDGSGAAVQKGVCLVVEQGRIIDICASAGVHQETSDKIEDYSHCTLLPPLVDCSLSLSSSASTVVRRHQGKSESGKAEMTSLIARHIHFCHSHGVLAVADGDDPANDVVSYRKNAADDKRIIIKASGPHCCTGDERCQIMAEQAKEFVRIAHSPDISDGEKAVAPFQDSARERLRQIRRQHQDKLTVVIANGSRAVADALDAGCHGIEQGFFMGADNLERMAAQGVTWIPTVLKTKIMLQETAGSAARFYKKAMTDQLDQLRIAREAGVKIVTGTGAGSSGIIHGESVAEEIKLFIQSGMSRVEAITCATSGGAEFLGLEEFGRLCVGMSATFIVTRGMVQQLPRKLLYLENIYINGTPSENYRKNPVKTVYKR